MLLRGMNRPSSSSTRRWCRASCAWSTRRRSGLERDPAGRLCAGPAAEARAVARSTSTSRPSSSAGSTRTRRTSTPSRPSSPRSTRSPRAGGHQRALPHHARGRLPAPRLRGARGSADAERPGHHPPEPAEDARVRRERDRQDQPDRDQIRSDQALVHSSAVKAKIINDKNPGAGMQIQGVIDVLDARTRPR
jgi:hypothetical protein